MTRQYLSNAAAYRVARDAKLLMNAAYDDYLATNSLDEIDDECELYLYVRSNEDWIIEHAQYLTDHRNIVAAVPLAHYNSIKELQQAIITDQYNYA